MSRGGGGGGGTIGLDSSSSAARPCRGGRRKQNRPPPPRSLLIDYPRPFLLIDRSTPHPLLTQIHTTPRTRTSCRTHQSSPSSVFFSHPNITRPPLSVQLITMVQVPVINSRKKESVAGAIDAYEVRLASPIGCLGKSAVDGALRERQNKQGGAALPSLFWRARVRAAAILNATAQCASARSTIEPWNHRPLRPREACRAARPSSSSSPPPPPPLTRRPPPAATAAADAALPFNPFETYTEIPHDPRR